MKLFGKLFKGQSAQQAVPLRAYGKLPFYAEYRRLEVAPGAATAYSQWLDEGRLTWIRATDSGAPGTTKTSRLVLYWPDSREWVVAHLRESHDSLGRVFPFTFFVACPPEALGDNLLQRWASCAAIHAQLADAHSHLGALATGGNFNRFYSQHAVALLAEDRARRADELQAQAAQIQFADWFAAADLSDVQPGEWFAGLLRRAERWRSQPAALAEAGLSLPLARDIPLDAQVALWLEWIANLTGGTRQPWMIVPASSTDGAGRLYLGFRDLLPADFQLLTTGAGAYGYVEDLAQIPAPPGDADPEIAVAAPTGSFLQALTRHPQA